LEAAGKDLKAVALGKALQDPLNNMTALRKAGILLTEEQQKQIESFMKANDVISAQDVLLKAIESQVGGTAEAIASSTDKMSAKFESVVEELSLALLPAVDDISQAMIDWLDSVEGKQAIQKLTDELIKFGEWIASPDGKQAIDDLVYSLKIMADTLSALVGFIKAAADGWQELVDTTRQKVVLPIMERFGAYTPPGTRSTNGAYPGAGPAQAPVTVNVNGVVSGPATSRTVLDAVKQANRLGMR
jgi:polyhydroxyalkanoate synthesis regulator phasin